MKNSSMQLVVLSELTKKYKTDITNMFTEEINTFLSGSKMVFSAIQQCNTI